MRRCIIHCGPHKTGSTSLQLGLEMHRDALGAAGIRVPHFTGSRSATASHKLLCDQMADFAEHGLEAAPAWGELADHLREHAGTTVISCEIFSTRMISRRHVDNVVPFLCSLGVRPEFVYLMRDQPSWINSLYVQQTKRFFTPLAFEPFTEQAHTMARFDYRRMLLRLMERDDVDVTVLPFESAAKAGLLASFLTALDHDPAGFDEPPRQNSNAGAKTVYVGRHIAAALAARGLKAEDHRDVFRAFKRRYEAMNWDDTPYCGFTDSSAEDLRQRFKASNDQLARQLWQCDWADKVPPRGGFSRQEFDPGAHWPWQHLDARRLLWDLRRMVARIE